MNNKVVNRKQTNRQTFNEQNGYSWSRTCDNTSYGTCTIDAR